jgi:hypothetical protein
MQQPWPLPQARYLLPLQGTDARSFWSAFERTVSVMVLGDLQEMLLAHACLGSSAAIPLMSNLARSFNSQLLPVREFLTELPQWMQEYVAGGG